LYKDLVERYDIRNSGLMKYLLKYLLANNANPITVNKIFSDVKSQGYKVAKDTLHSYLAYLEDTLCLSLVPIYTDSMRKQQINYRKVYFLDHGLVTTLVPSRAYNSGRLLETMVYNHLRQRYGREQLFYLKTATNQEVNFVVQERGKLTQLIQVCETLENPHTKVRESNALFQAMGELGLDTGFIISRQEAEQIERNEKVIKVVPFWEWAMEE